MTVAWILAAEREPGRRSSSSRSSIPLFLLLLFGLIEVGRLIYLQNAFNEAAREAARYGSVEQWLADCPSKASPVNRFECTGQVARERIAGAPATVEVDVSCAPMVAGPSPAPTLPTGRMRDRRPPDGQGLHAIHRAGGPAFFTPIIGQLIPAPVVSGQAQVVIQ